MSYKSRERMSEGKFIQSDLVAGQGGVNCKKATALGQMASPTHSINRPQDIFIDYLSTHEPLKGHRRSSHHKDLVPCRMNLPKKPPWE